MVGVPGPTSSRRNLTTETTAADPDKRPARGTGLQEAGLSQPTLQEVEEEGEWGEERGVVVSEEVELDVREEFLGPEEVNL